MCNCRPVTVLGKTRPPGSGAAVALAKTNPQALPACDAAIGLNACRDATPVQLAASLSGTVWQDVGSSPRVLDAGDVRLSNWQVQVIDQGTGAVVATTTTGNDGTYRVNNLLPGVPLS